MNIITPDGKTLVGTPVQVVQQMRSTAMFPSTDLDEYMTAATARASELMGAKLHVAGATLEERCADFVRSMVAAGLAVDQVRCSLCGAMVSPKDAQDITHPDDTQPFYACASHAVQVPTNPTEPGLIKQ